MTSLFPCISDTNGQTSDRLYCYWWLDDYNSRHLNSLSQSFISLVLEFNLIDYLHGWTLLWLLLFHLQSTYLYMLIDIIKDALLLLLFFLIFISWNQSLWPHLLLASCSTLYLHIIHLILQWLALDCSSIYSLSHARLSNLCMFSTEMSRYLWWSSRYLHFGTLLALIFSISTRAKASARFVCIFCWKMSNSDLIIDFSFS